MYVLTSLSDHIQQAEDCVHGVCEKKKEKKTSFDLNDSELISKTHLMPSDKCVFM